MNYFWTCEGGITVAVNRPFSNKMLTSHKINQFEVTVNGFKTIVQHVDFNTI